MPVWWTVILVSLSHVEKSFGSCEPQEVRVSICCTQSGIKSDSTRKKTIRPRKRQKRSFYLMMFLSFGLFQSSIQQIDPIELFRLKCKEACYFEILIQDIYIVIVLSFLSLNKFLLLIYCEHMCNITEFPKPPWPISFHIFNDKTAHRPV